MWERHVSMSKSIERKRKMRQQDASRVLEKRISQVETTVHTREQERAFGGNLGFSDFY